MTHDQELSPFDTGFLAGRMRQMKPAAIAKFFELAASMPDPCDLSIGQPNFAVPDALKTAAKAAIDRGDNRYSPQAGVGAMRERCLAYLKSQYTYDTSGDELAITNGCAGGLLLCFLSLLEAGDEVLVPEPYFVIYGGQAALVGATIKYVDTFPDFRLRVEALERHRTARTKVLVLNSPHNPTGTVYTAEELRAVAEWAREHRIFVISDEVYDRFVFDGPHVSIKQFYPEGTAILGGFSKTWGAPGWRIGFALLPKFLFAAAMAVQMNAFVCAPTPLQFGMDALGVDMSPIVADLKCKRDAVLDGLRDLYPCVVPAGTFYMFPQVPERLQADFMQRAMAHRLLVVPGPAFCRREAVTHIRLSLAVSDATLQRGIGILRDLAGEK